MTTRKSGLLGMILGVAFLAACDPKTEVIVPPTGPDTTRVISLNLVPDTATIEVGRTVTLVPVVTGTTNQAVTFTSSNTSVATVSAAGVVTGVAVGRAVITAVSQADARARDATVVNVVAVAPPPPPPAASINISAITQGGTNQPVNTQNITGQIDVLVNADIPVGFTGRLEVLVDNTAVCTQSFTGTGDIDVTAAAVPVQIVCSINTAEFNPATGAPRFGSGPHTIGARLIGPTGATVASATTQQVIFNNPNFITATVQNLATGTATAGRCANAGTDARSLGGPGSRWCAGDLTITLTPVIFSGTNDRLASATVTLVTSGLGVSGLENCDASANALTAGTVAPEDSGINNTLEDGSARVGVGGAAPGNNTQFGVLFRNAAGAALTMPDSDNDGLVDFPGCGRIVLTQTDADASNGLSVTFSAQNEPDCVVQQTCVVGNADGIFGVEDIFAIVVNSTTAGGASGPVCINPDPALNPVTFNGLPACGVGVSINPGGFQVLLPPFASGPNVAFFPPNTTAPVRLDNLAPRVTLFDLRPDACERATLGPQDNCFLNASFAFAPRAPRTVVDPINTALSVQQEGFFMSVDYGVDDQNRNTVFQAGEATTSLVTVRTAGDLPETANPNVFLLRASVSDALGNTRNVFPTFTPTTTTTNVNLATRFGVDKTTPTFDLSQSTMFSFTCPAGVPTCVPPTNNGANDGTQFVIVFSDPATVGAAGFGLRPVWARAQRTGLSATLGVQTTCRDPETGQPIDPFGIVSGCTGTFVVVRQGGPCFGVATTAGDPAGSCRVLAIDGFMPTDGVFNLGGPTPGAGGQTPAVTTCAIGAVSCDAYWRVSWLVEDAAGNRSASQVWTTLLDNQAPTAGAVVTPSVIVGTTSTPPSVSATVTAEDFIDLGDLRPGISFNTIGSFNAGVSAGTHLTYPAQEIEPYGPENLQRIRDVTFTINPFIRTLQTTDNNGVPTGPNQPADAISVLVRDAAGVVDSDPCPAANAADGSFTVAGFPNPPVGAGARGNCVLRTQPIANAVAAGFASVPTRGSFAARANASIASFTIAASNTLICNSSPFEATAPQPCPTNPASTVLTATAQGTTVTLEQNQIRTVNFYYIERRAGVVTGRAILIGQAVAPTITDNPATGVRQMRWQTTWTPTPAVEASNPGTPYEVFAVAVDDRGDGLRSPNMFITVALD